MKGFCLVLTAILATFLGVTGKPLDSLRVEVIKGNRYILHKVDKNETWSEILKRYRVTTPEVLKANELKSAKAEKGQVLRIPYLLPDTASRADTSALDEAHANAQSQETKKLSTHVVLQGETLNGIAKKYKLTAAQISKWNALKSAKVVVGQVLIIDENAVAKPYIKINGPEAQLPQSPPQAELAKADLIEQTGIAIIDETMKVAHAEAPPGTIIKVINLDNNLQCLVRVTDKIDPEKYQNVIITLGKEVQQKLNTNEATIRVKLVYAVTVKP